MKKFTRFLRGCAGMAALVLSLGVLAPLPARAAAVGPQDQEMKLLLKPSLFTNRKAGYEQCWQLVKALAKDMDVAVQEEAQPFKEGVRKVVFYDTQDGKLSGKNYILRQRIKISKGVPIPVCDLTLKYRVLNKKKVDDHSVEAASGLKVDTSLQKDYVGFYKGVVGKNVGEMSLSKTVKNVPLTGLKTLGDYGAYFPTLKKVGLPLETVVMPTHGISVREYKVSPGSLNFAGIKGDVDISLWYNYDKDSPITAEISWECPLTPVAAEAKAEAFFNALQTKAQGWLVPGRMKADFVYHPEFSGK